MQQLKQDAAEYAVNHFINSGMVVGLGEGSTAVFAIRHLAALIKNGTLTHIRAIPTSKNVQRIAQDLGIPLTTLEDVPSIDVTIDGADEVTPALDLIKGGGGALLREKIVAQATHLEIIVVDPSKQVPALGTNWALPIEVLPFGWGAQIRFLESLGGTPTLRRDDQGELKRTDQDNYIIDCHFGAIDDPQTLAAQLGARAGIVEHGMFLGLAHRLIVASDSGIQIIERGT